MRDKNTKPGYYNYVDGGSPKITKKTIIVASLAVFVLVSVIVLAFTYRNGSNQNTDNEEPAMEFISEDSRIAGIQLLTQNGLTNEQFDDVCKKLTEYFDNNYPNATYFNYVTDSLQIMVPETTYDEEISYLSAEEEAELLASIADARVEEGLPPEDETYEEDRDNDGIGNASMVFEMESNTSERFEIQISFPANPKIVELEINKK